MIMTHTNIMWTSLLSNQRVSGFGSPAYNLYPILEFKSTWSCVTHSPYQVSGSLVINLDKAECQYSERALRGQHEKEIQERQCSLRTCGLFSPFSTQTVCSIGSIR